MTELESHLVKAWENASGDEPLDALLRQSLVAAASQSPHLKETVRRLETGKRAQLDLHIDAEGDEDVHEVPASTLGKFLIRAVDAVKSLAKSTSGIQRLHGDLNALAPAQGSVKLVLIEAATDEVRSTSTRESDEAWQMGVTRLTDVMALSQDDSPTLVAALADLDLPSLEALRKFGDLIAVSGWRLHGHSVSRAGIRGEFELSGRGAQRLTDAASITDYEDKEVEFYGMVDGWRWSNSIMRLKPADGSRAIEAFVPSSFRDYVAELNATEGKLVLARFSEVYPKGHEQGVKPTYSLLSVQPLLTLEDMTGED